MSSGQIGTGVAGFQPRVYATKRCSASASQGYVEPRRFVEINVRLGDYDAAFAWLEKAFERRSSWIPTIAFDPLRADPRLSELIERLRPVNPFG